MTRKTEKTPQRSIPYCYLDDLKPHEEYLRVYGDPEDLDEYKVVLRGVMTSDRCEPLVVLQNGTVVVGHLRYAALQALGRKTAPIIVQAFESYREETIHVLLKDPDQRHYTFRQTALAWERLRNLIRDENESDKRTSPACNSPEEQAAKILKMDSGKALALGRLFLSDDVPMDLKDAVDRMDIGWADATSAIEYERTLQNGCIVDPTRLRIWMQQMGVDGASFPSSGNGFVDRRQLTADMLAASELFRRIHELLSRRPLKTLAGTPAFGQYKHWLMCATSRLVDDIMTAECQTSDAKTKLTVVVGGRSAEGDKTVPTTHPERG